GGLAWVVVCRADHFRDHGGQYYNGDGIHLRRGCSGKTRRCFWYDRRRVWPWFYCWTGARRLVRRDRPAVAILGGGRTEFAQRRLWIFHLARIACGRAAEGILVS